MKNAEILEGLQGVERVLVRTPEGKSVYKSPKDVTEEDSIQTKRDGSPIVCVAPPGRPTSSAPLTASDPGGFFTVQMGEHVRHDPVVMALRRDMETSAVLSQVLSEIGQDIARLDYLRVQTDPNRRAEIADLTVKRIRALGSFYDTLAHRFELSKAQNIPDVRSPVIKEVVRTTLETARDGMVKAGVRSEVVDAVFTLLGPILSEPSWEAQLRSRMEKSVTG